jgi:hypothetical protein
MARWGSIVVKLITVQQISESETRVSSYGKFPKPVSFGEWYRGGSRERTYFG